MSFEPHDHSDATPMALAWLLGLAGAAWVVAARQMDGMDMGTSTELGPFGFFVALWVSMMAAMMLPGAVPAAAANARRGGVLAVPRFALAYLAVWTPIGVAVYAVYRPHDTAAAGGLAIAAGIYELTPVKRHCRRRCLSGVRSGLELGVWCVGSSIGLMVLLLAVGAMSLTWMAIVAALVAAQKLLPPRAALDVPLALAIVALGALIVAAPTAVPGLTPAM
jgi:predicted metal-binding membrane protein